MLRLVALLSTALIVPQTAFAGGIATPLAASSVDNPKEFWRGFMQHFYGAYDSINKCWITSKADKKYCMRPNTLVPVIVSGKPHYFISVAGEIVVPGDDNQCHACVGNLGLFVLATEGKSLVVVAEADRLNEYGTYGNPPREEDVKVTQIGANDQFGFVITTSDFGQGLNYDFAHVLAPAGGQIPALGTFITHFDNSGGCEGDKCSDYSFELTFDTTKAGRFAPVIMRSTGTRNGDALEQTFTALFDEATFLYKLPQNLPEEVQ
jgi:hypothetical protein